MPKIFLTKLDVECISSIGCCIFTVIPETYKNLIINFEYNHFPKMTSADLKINEKMAKMATQSRDYMYSYCSQSEGLVAISHL